MIKQRAPYLTLGVTVFLSIFTNMALCDIKPSISLPPACRQKLFQLKTPIAAPAYLPLGFKLTGCDVGNLKDKEYHLTYKNPRKASVTLYSNPAEELGDVGVSNGITGQIPAGFAGTLYIGHSDPASYSGNPKDVARLIQSEWITDRHQKQAYRIEGDKGVSLKEVVKVFQSLGFLSPH